MTSVKNRGGFALTLSREKIRETYKLSPKEKLEWLEEANEFVNKILSPKKRRMWMEKTR